MATKRITVSVPVEIATRIKRAAGRRRSVSEWVTNAMIRTLEEDDLERRFLEFCDDVKATPAQEAQARASFDKILRGKRGSPRRDEPARGRTAA